MYTILLKFANHVYTIFIELERKLEKNTKQPRMPVLDLLPTEDDDDDFIMELPVENRVDLDSVLLKFEEDRVHDLSRMMSFTAWRKQYSVNICYNRVNRVKDNFRVTMTHQTGWKEAILKVIVTLFSSGCLQIGFGVLIIDYICNFLI